MKAQERTYDFLDPDLVILSIGQIVHLIVSYGRDEAEARKRIAEFKTEINA